MSLKISEENCIACGACESICPNEAIKMGGDFYAVDPEKCTECFGFYESQQCVTVCPQEALGLDPTRNEDKEMLWEKYKRLYPNKDPKYVNTWKNVLR